MKFYKIISALLVCILTVSPALAAVCATSCVAVGATISAHKQSSEHCRMMVGMNKHKSLSKPSLQQVSFNDNTQSATHKRIHDQSTSHAGCGMLGCNTIQALPLLSVLKVHFFEPNPIVLTSHHTFGISADLLPPIKPPA